MSFRNIFFKSIDPLLDMAPIISELSQEKHAALGDLGLGSRNPDFRQPQKQKFRAAGELEHKQASLSLSSLQSDISWAFYFLATAWHLIKAVEWGLAGDVWRVLLECDEGCIGTTKNKLERSLSRKIFFFLKLISCQLSEDCFSIIDFNLNGSDPTISWKSPYQFNFHHGN